MFKLAPIVFTQGLESDSATKLSALQNIATITPPVTIAAMRSQLETGQLQPFTDSGFNKYLIDIYALPLDNASLTAAERTILQNIRAYINPSPKYSCCGVSTPTALNTTVVAYKRIGSGSFEYELQVQFDSDVTCDVAFVETTITPTGGAPAAVVSPLSLPLLGCIDNKAVYSFLFADFVGDPSGLTYDFSLSVEDALGSPIAAYTISGIVLP